MKLLQIKVFFFFYLIIIIKLNNLLKYLINIKIGMTSHYMSLIDFFFEGTIEFLIMIILFSFGGSPISFICFACSHSVNTVIVHSGYKIKFLPNPEHHYLHHIKYNINFGIGPFDYFGL
jgi:sterol desaturase/sphingolipid hydroxylase (fatty acid hydroxylase superfamily)